MFLGLNENYVCSCFQLFIFNCFLFCVHVLLWVHMCRGMYAEVSGLLTGVSSLFHHVGPTQTGGQCFVPDETSHLMGPLFSLSNTSLCIYPPPRLFSVEALKTRKVARHCDSVQHFLQV